MRHKDKVKLARKMRTKDEEIGGVGIFLSKAWDERRKAIQKRVTNQSH